MKTLRRQITTALLLTLLALLAYKPSNVRAANETTDAPIYSISEISYTHQENSQPVLTIKGASQQPPTFISYDLFDPLRLVIDIADGQFSDNVSLPLELNTDTVTSVQGTIVTDQKPAIAKIEVLLAEDNQYVIEKTGNEIQVIFEKTAPSPSSPVADNQETAITSPSLEIVDVVIESANDTVKVVLHAGQPITDYERVVLPKGKTRPDRMYLDIHGAKSPSIASVLEVNKGALARLRTSAKEQGTRIVFDSKVDQLFDYSIDTIPEGLQVTITPPTGQLAQTSTDDSIGNLLSEISNSEDKKPSENSSTKSKIAEQLKGVGVSGDSFVDAGYDKNRYTVDFYKTNIENVFYLLKELSGKNFVVDDSVSGTVTLYLEQVPWDFILDVVLNLKGLQKAEKFNTIVISPQSKNFTWPEESVSEEGTFEAPDQELVAVLDEQLSQPPEVTEAKMLIKKANELVQNKQLAGALETYKKAYVLWPDNVELIKQIATFCLVEMNNYICAEDYASKALALNENDQEAALQIAITRGNMGKDDANVFFEKAVKGERPTPSALLNYAAYTEGQGETDKALSILDRYESIYERTLTTMVAKARIFDKTSQSEKAEEIYEAILKYTGFDLPADLEKFIKGRLALRETQH